MPRRVVSTSGNSGIEVPHYLSGKKNPGMSGAGIRCVLLDLTFLVDHVLPRNGIILLHFQLIGRSPLVFIRGVKVAGARC